jgi:plastocyanin
MVRDSLARPVAALLLGVLAIVGCTPGASPSPQAASPAASPSASAAASASPSGSAEASGAPSGSAEASAEASGVAGADITVSAVDYAFAGIPDGVPPGTVLGLRNDGNEVHEMLVYRINDDVVQTLPEILALPQEEALKLITEVGGAIAAPGEDAEDTVTVDEAGAYAMICAIPFGTTEMPEGSPPPAGGAPHFTAGMAKAFSVGE